MVDGGREKKVWVGMIYGIYKSEQWDGEKRMKWLGLKSGGKKKVALVCREMCHYLCKNGQSKREVIVCALGFKCCRL